MMDKMMVKIKGQVCGMRGSSELNDVMIMGTEKRLAEKQIEYDI